MARTAFIVSAAAAAMVLTALPFASATSPNADMTAQTSAPVEQLPAMNANMLNMNMCSDRSHIVSELEQQFQENVTAVGMVDQNAVVEIFVSDSGSWTILATGTDGNSCIISAGEGWESTQMVRGTDA
ncbi:hypothetical protein GTW25_08635 [Aliihoeflea aestuarii]|jgi:hypothetical protein|uniref:hypothetical protein n=1 Tax=Aliihoeflea aestuarii TaxID=453840 RepID=UPI0020933963|nr:hypothetical protein [Aliihoeflea aestuarii]MCO6391093.1 hypothetical protein [Aliihoeflea aestuarii]